MPVSKKRKKKNGRSAGMRYASPQLRRPEEDLAVGPWRAYMRAAEQGAEEGLLDVLASWPYRVSDGSGPGSMVSIALDAHRLGQSIEEVIESAAFLEDQGFMTWDTLSQTAFLTLPADGVPVDESDEAPLTV